MASVVGVAGESRLAEGSDPELGARALHCLFWGMAMNQLTDVRGYSSVAVFGQFRKWLGREG
jgi:hypothetical protein